MTNQRVLRWIAIAAAILATAALTLFNVSLSMSCSHSVGCVGQYWADFWLVSYSDGYERRALLGEVMRAVFGSRIDYVALNVIAFALAIFTLSAIYWRFFRRMRGREGLIVALMLVSGPTTTLFFEVLGDPLQAALLVFLAYAAAATAAPRMLNVVLALTAAVIVTLIHEASVFLLIPGIYLTHCVTTKQRANLKWLGVVVVGLAALYALALSQQSPTGPGLELLTRDGSVVTASGELLPSYRVLLEMEFQRYFGSIEGAVRFAYKCFGVVTWPVLLWLLMWRICKETASLRVFIFLLIASLPLYVIAHDWGRFSIYSICIALFISSLRSDEEIAAVIPVELPRLLDVPLQFIGRIDVRFACLFPLFYLSYAEYRLWGVSAENIMVLGAATVIAGATQYLAATSNDKQPP